MNQIQEQSRIDAKLRRDALLNNGVWGLWEDLRSSIGATAKRPNDEMCAGLRVEPNEDQTSIKVVAADTVKLIDGSRTRLTPSIRITFDPDQRKVTGRLEFSPYRLTSYSIKPDELSNSLHFVGNGRPCGQLGVAETLIAEQLCEINLDS
jgi:hypothetical protein